MPLQQNFKVLQNLPYVCILRMIIQNAVFMKKEYDHDIVTNSNLLF